MAERIGGRNLLLTEGLCNFPPYILVIVDIVHWFNLVPLRILIKGSQLKNPHCNSENCREMVISGFLT